MQEPAKGTPQILIVLSHIKAHSKHKISHKTPCADHLLCSIVSYVVQKNKLTDMRKENRYSSFAAFSRSWGVSISIPM
jgi:hypothetical protein